MKTKLMGLGILAAVIVAAVVYVWVWGRRGGAGSSGYGGGEKNGLLEDEGYRRSCGISIVWRWIMPRLVPLRW